MASLVSGKRFPYKLLVTNSALAMARKVEGVTGVSIFDFLRAKKPISGDLAWKDNASAFDYACKFMDCRILEGEAIPALVDKVEALPDGRQTCSLRITSDEGGREVTFCQTLNENVPTLKVGDFVAYRVISFFPESHSKIAALSVMGFIVAKLKPAWSIEHNSWRVSGS